ncbi:MAG: four helix bundle protein [Calditrichaeota bacterium]|nr:four helix bundle protein [Calditrichota bacterium]MCB9369412.1 four helix bundle protein [Calditrichota bacterium]
MIDDLKNRTKAFAVRIIGLHNSLREKNSANVIAHQVLKSGTSVGAHCAEASRAKSRADFLNKIVGATQELEETLYWLDLMVEARLVKATRPELLRKEADELMAILTTIAKKTKTGKRV